MAWHHQRADETAHQNTQSLSRRGTPTRVNVPHENPPDVGAQNGPIRFPAVDRELILPGRNQQTSCLGS